MVTTRAGFWSGRTARARRFKSPLREFLRTESGGAAAASDTSTKTIAVTLAFRRGQADDVVHIGDVASLAVIDGSARLRRGRVGCGPPHPPAPRRGAPRRSRRRPQQLTPRRPKPEEAPVAQR